MKTAKQSALRPLASLPNKEGFVVVGVRRDGAEAQLTVYLDADGFHKVPGFKDLAGWRMP